MKAVLLAVGVLGLGAFIAMFEPGRASAAPVTSKEVRLVSEQLNAQTPGRTCLGIKLKGKGRHGCY
jgi:hypothetical protein